MLIHATLAPELATARPAPEPMYRVVVLIQCSLVRKLAIALGTPDTVLRVEMPVHRSLVIEFAETRGTFDTMFGVIVLLHPIPSLEFAIALRALYHAVLLIVVPIPSYLCGEFSRAFTAFEAWSGIVVLPRSLRPRPSVTSWAARAMVRIVVFIRFTLRPKGRPADGAYGGMFCPEMRCQALG